MKRAIAMKCSQEQFDGIKGKLEGYYDNIGDFSEYPYLLTEYYNRKAYVYNSNIPFEINSSKVYHDWNEQIFLEACGIEVDKLEYQYYHRGDWRDTSYKLRIKPKHSKEIEKIEALAKEIGYKVILEKL